MENNEEIKDQDMGEEYKEGGAKEWLRDNLRIIISVLIVVIIAGGIYSYSKRSEAPVATTSDQKEQSTDLASITGSDENKTIDDQSSQSQATEQKDNATVNQEKNKQNQEQAKPDEQSKPQEQQAKPQDQTSSVSTSQETGNSFVETASRGDSATTLARRAVANYLEKNSDSNLTAEHKVYIEDYLVKNSGHKGKVNVGSSVEFQKDLIQKAVSQSKNLSAGQLQNLHKYAVRVPSLS